MLREMGNGARGFWGIRNTNPPHSIYYAYKMMSNISWMETRTKKGIKQEMNLLIKFPMR